MPEAISFLLDFILHVDVHLQTFATPATKGAKVRTKGMKRASTIVMPPYFS